MAFKFNPITGKLDLVSAKYWTLNGTDLEPVGSYNVDLSSGNVYKINDTQVLASDGSNFILSNCPLPTGGALLNTVIGRDAGCSLTSGVRNNLFGYKAGFDLTTGSKNQLIGVTTGSDMTTGIEVVAVGNQALGGSGVNPTGSVVIGYQAGLNASGDYNVLLGYKAGYFEFTGNNKLYIANSNTTTPLLYGEFDTPYLLINGTHQIDGGQLEKITKVETSTYTVLSDDYFISIN